ncbi:hypothetical protein EJB05_46150, partial [Eragrostis curvula]
MVPLRDGGQEPALTWAHYKRVADVPDENGRDFRTVADRVVGELWVSLVYIELVNTSRSLDILQIMKVYIASVCRIFSGSSRNGVTVRCARCTMHVGGGKKHGQYWIVDNTLDTTSTPTLSEIRARSSSSAPPIRPWPSAAQIQFDQAQAQLREEMEAKLQAQEVKYQAQLQKQQARYDARLQEQHARMQEDLQRQMQMMFHQWHSGGMQPPPLPLPPPVGTSSPSQGTPVFAECQT